MCIDTVSLPNVSRYDDISIYRCISIVYNAHRMCLHKNNLIFQFINILAPFYIQCNLLLSSIYTYVFTVATRAVNLFLPVIFNNLITGF